MECIRKQGSIFYIENHILIFPTLPVTSHVSSGEVHNPIEPLPEGEAPVGQRLPTELGPGDHERLEVVRTEVGVPTDVEHYKMC